MDRKVDIDHYVNCSPNSAKYYKDEDDTDVESQTDSFINKGKSAKFTFTDKQILKLIKEYKRRPCLWQKNHEDFKSLTKKQQNIEEIGQILNINCEIIKEKLRNLRVIYFQNVKKEKKVNANGRSRYVKPRWRFYNSLSFLSETKAISENNDHFEKQNTTETVSLPSPANAAEENDSEISESIAIDEDENHSTIHSMVQNTEDVDTFGTYVEISLAQIKDEVIKKRAKYQVQLVLSAALAEHAKNQLSNLSSFNENK